MSEKAKLLYKLYENDDKLCFCFSKDLRILWLNKKFKTTFPKVTEGIFVTSCFPGFDFTFITTGNAPDYTVKIKDKYAEKFLEIIPFNDNECLYVGILRAVPEDASLSEHKSIDLLSYYIRQKTGRLFNLSEIISNNLVENKDYESSHYMRDIERIWRSVLKLSSNFSAYHSILEDPSVHKNLTDFGDFMTTLMNQVEKILAPSKLSFTFEPDFHNGLVMLDPNLFATAILNIINISYLYTKEDGLLICKTQFANGELILTLEDNVTDYNEIESSDYSDFTLLDATGEPPAMKKIYYDFLKKTIYLHGGKITVTDNKPGVKIVISLESSPTDGMSVSSSATSSYRSMSGKLGLVDIMLSDVTY